MKTFAGKIAAVLGLACMMLVLVAVIGASMVALSKEFAADTKNCLLVGAIGFLVVFLYDVKRRRRKK